MAVVAAVVVQREDVARSNLGPIASRNGLVVQDRRHLLGIVRAPARASGTLGGYAVELFPCTVGDSEGGRPSIGVRVGVETSMRFSITRHSRLSYAFPSRRAREARFDDEAFDRELRVETDDFPRLSVLFEETRRARFVAALADVQDLLIEVDERGILYAEPGGFHDADHCRRAEVVLGLLLDLARALDQERTSRGARGKAA